MNTQNWPFSVEQLWKGSVLASIAHAIAVSRWPELSNEQSWDNSSYSIQDSMGSRGTICFALPQQGFPVRCAGAMFGAKSDRSKLEQGLPRDGRTYFAGMPEETRPLAEESLQYLLDEFAGQVQPWITAALWSSGTSLVSQDAWEEFREHGGHLIERQLIALDVAVSAWGQAYKLTGDERSMLTSLYSRRVAHAGVELILTTDEHRIIETNEIGIDESWEAFSALGIRFPAVE